MIRRQLFQSITCLCVHELYFQISFVKMNASKIVIDLAASDRTYAEMLDLLKWHVPDLEAVDFFEPNSCLRYFEPALLTNFHMHSVLYFHYRNCMRL